MERLRELLSAKVSREKQLAASGDARPDEETKECWLCAKKTRTRFRFRDGMRVCFQCFRVTYLALALPSIDTPSRRQSDIDFLRRIAELEKLTDGGGDAGTSLLHAARSSDSDALFSTVEVMDPTQAHFVMDASFMRRHHSQNSSSPSPTPHSTTAPSVAQPAGDLDKPWTCPECTFFNRPGLRECEACGFVNPGVVKCPVCGQRCPVAGSEEAGTKCKNGKAHVVWRCPECAHVNTLDGDACTRCHKPRYWACLQCTALHSSPMGQDGLRYCPTCGSYNTPDDVVRGQAKIEREHKKAELVAAQQREDSRGDYDDGDKGNVQFGVNDSVTLAEVQRQSEIEHNRARLQARLSRLNVPRHEQKSDGNCLFSALAHQLFGNPRLHILVRSLIVAYMRLNEEDYAILFESKKEWSAYVERMSQPGCWGDELCLNAAARCFCVNVHVITSDEKRWHMIFQQDQLGKSNSNLRDEVTAAQSRKLPSTLTETPTQLSYTRRTGGGGSSNAGHGPAAQQGVCLFLAYQAPVHYDDITPSPVKAIVLSDLLQPELHALLKSQGGGQAPAAAGTATRPTQAPPHSTASTVASSSSVPASAPAAANTAPALPSLGRAASSSSGSYVPSRTAVSANARHTSVPGDGGAVTAQTLVAPRSRGPGSSAGLDGDTLPPPTSGKRGSR